jgi:hypothetical protein
MIKRSKNNPALAERQAQGWRLSVQMRKHPIQWAPGQREALIEQAVNAGNVKQYPAGLSADGTLSYHAIDLHSSGRFAVGSKRSGAL